MASEHPPQPEEPGHDPAAAPGHDPAAADERRSSVRRLPDADLGRFPALAKLRWRGRSRRIPYVQQLEAADCGAACLSMVLGYYGRHVRLDDLREAMGVGRDGANALVILRTAESYGLRGRGLKLEIEALHFLPPASILHWGFNHFVVFERVTRHGVHIVDPAGGRRFIPMERFRRQFTGVAIELNPSEAFKVGAADKSFVWSYLSQLMSEHRVLARVVMTSVLLRVFALAVPLLTGFIVDRVVPRSDLHLLTVIGSGLAAMVLFQFFSALIRAHLLLQLRTNLDTKMTLGFVDYLVDLPYMFFQRRAEGDLMMRVNSNATIRELLTSNSLSALLDGSLVLIYLVLIFALSTTIGGLVLALGCVQITIFVLSRRRYRELMAQGLEAQAQAQSYLVQLLGGIETLKAMGAEHRAVEHWSDLFVDELNVSLQRGRLAALVESLMDSLRTASPLLILAIGAALVLDGSLSLGTMLALNALAISFLTPLSSLVSSAIQLQLLASYVERIDDVFSSEPEQDRDKTAQAPRLRGHVRLDQVSFRYTPQTPLVVREVSLDIPPGTSVAIVGKSGSGKSTLAKLLLGLYPPTEGQIFYDDKNLAELDLRSVRQQLGIVPQNPYIFANSLRANIALGNPRIPLRRIQDAARQACIHEVIHAMPMGYETLVGSGGGSLSGGERQRLALARALVNEPAILLLDEATSALDAKTEATVIANLERQRSTRVVIAHRLSTIVNADLILVMDQGRVVEQGSHAELMAKRGTYSELVAAQTQRDEVVTAASAPGPGGPEVAPAAPAPAPAAEPVAEPADGANADAVDLEPAAVAGGAGRRPGTSVPSPERAGEERDG
ncbi:peptidase domain-containing ABC transporter [Haliangium sp.]|uniref:peptidase domain-containing ABC transporter n=1 Tax=Haliangium sp. TaxID=2663208 RepID=UPI003D0FA4BB